MTVVVDASVVLAALVDDGPDGRWAETVLLDGQTLLAPHLMPAEVTNVVRRGLAAGRFEPVGSGLALSRLSELDVELYPFAPFAERVWALRQNVTSYDAWYVAVAEAVGTPLATLDRRLAAAPGTTCRFSLPDRR